MLLLMLKKLKARVFFIHFILTGGETSMVDFYVTAIMFGLRTFAQVPAFLQEQVKEAIDALGIGELAE